MSQGEEHIVCVAARRGPAAAETFVRAHMERLSGQTVTLFGPELSCTGSGRRAGPPRLLRRAAGLLTRATGRPLDEALIERWLLGFLRRRGVDVVLAEFGPVGTTLAEPCRRAGVPLVVHFHGYDAYRQDMRQRFGAAYEQMFRTCGAVVAVSHPMVGQLRSLGAPAESIRVNPCGADCDLF